MEYQKYANHSDLKRTVFTFSPGPSQFPREVLIRAKDELLNWKGRGISVLEMSHRSQDYVDLYEKTIADLRSIMGIPSTYEVLYMQGGATLQFAAVPLNLMKNKKKASYLVTGNWSDNAYKEAELFGHPSLVYKWPEKGIKHNTVPSQSDWQLDPEANYLYYCDNETVNGVEFDFIPQTPYNIPIASDMTSNFMSREVDWSKIDLVVAGAQKNYGPSGLCTVIMKKSLINKPELPVGKMESYLTQKDFKSAFNTPPVFSIYLAGLYFEYIQYKGGVKYFENIAQQKSRMIYDVMDSSHGFYYNHVNKKYRSRMNIPFCIKDEKLEPVFVKEAAKVGLIETKGHKSVGGNRVSLYNGMGLEEAEKLRDFMLDFMKKHQKQKKVDQLLSCFSFQLSSFLKHSKLIDYHQKIN